MPKLSAYATVIVSRSCPSNEHPRVIMDLEAGVDIIKIFPGELFGPKLSKSILGPLPQALNDANKRRRFIRKRQ
jgi:2-keto-3-deoxy-6-phosphogluconate aldolase